MQCEILHIITKITSHEILLDDLSANSFQDLTKREVIMVL